MRCSDIATDAVAAAAGAGVTNWTVELGRVVEYRYFVYRVIESSSRILRIVWLRLIVSCQLLSCLVIGQLVTRRVGWLRDDKFRVSISQGCFSDHPRMCPINYTRVTLSLT